MYTRMVLGVNACQLISGSDLGLDRSCYISLLCALRCNVRNIWIPLP
ncbi:hypothetical protein RchiOBHm_Chr2g0110851 [Rosa chinensis]|uniref:Uncharacterized protein n=1 Tax=Rosa chinensis TaxID=74649 RepID=A0A2P6RPV6_ROSCH|nr:hypothetical protein RchiOBHm_Chr2g0110851 [Rosa chinensis]